MGVLNVASNLLVICPNNITVNFSGPENPDLTICIAGGMIHGQLDSEVVELRVIGKGLKDGYDGQSMNVFKNFESFNNSLGVDTPRIPNNCINHWEDLDVKSLVFGLL
jgi:hypothetical protein